MAVSEEFILAGSQGFPTIGATRYFSGVGWPRTTQVGFWVQGNSYATTSRSDSVAGRLDLDPGAFPARAAGWRTKPLWGVVLVSW